MNNTDNTCKTVCIAFCCREDLKGCMTQTVKKNYSPNKCKLVQLLWKKSMTVPQKLKRKLPFSSVAQSYPTLCDPTDCNTPGFPVYHQLLEFTQTHVHWVGDAIQPPHPLSSPSPPTFNLSQHQGLFQWVSSSHQVAKASGVSASASVLPMNIQDWFPLRWTGWISLQFKGLSRVFSNTTVQKHNSSVLSFLYDPTLIS